MAEEKKDGDSYHDHHATVAYNTDEHLTEWGGAWHSVEMFNKKIVARMNGQKEVEFMELLALYVPMSVPLFMLVEDNPDPTAGEDESPLPVVDPLTTAVCIIDFKPFLISVYEKVRKLGPGPEHQEITSRHFDNFFSAIVKAMAAEGGDMAAATSHEVICYWPDTAEPVADRARRAVQAALAVLAQYDVDYKNAGAECAIKIGVGVGSLSFVHLGGVANRLQVVACGPASDQAFKAAREAKPGEVACSADTWKAIGKAFKPSRKAAGGVKTVQRGASGAALAPKPLDRHFLKLDPSVIEEAEIEWSTTCYMPQSVAQSFSQLHEHQEFWSNEKRHVTMLFINPNIDQSVVLGAAARAFCWA